MPNILEKTIALATTYGGQEPLNTMLKTLGTLVANTILREPKPIPPLKKLVEYGKTQLVLDKQDENYLLALSKYQKRITVAQRSNQNDTTLQDITFRVLVANYPVDTANSQEQLKGYLEDLASEVAGVTLEEENAILPDDETLD